MADSSPTALRVRDRGFAVIKGHCADSSSLDAFRKLGRIDQIDGLRLVQHLSPHEAHDATPNTYSGNFGLDTFPPHTDLAHWVVPPRYVALRCIQGAPDVGTQLVDGHRLISAFGASSLRMTLVKPRRTMRGVLNLLRILERPVSASPFLIRWDSLYLKPANKLAEAVMDQLNVAVAEMPRVSVVLSEPGDTIVIDNWRWIHGRDAVTNTAARRHIVRTYLKELL